MPDDNIQHPPDPTRPATAAARDEGISASPAAGAVAPAAGGPRVGGPGAAPDGAAGKPEGVRAWFSYNLKYIGICFGVGLVAVFVLRMLDIPTRQVAGLSAILAVLSGIVARAWLGPRWDRKPRTAEQGADSQSQVSNTREVIETVVFVVVLVLLLKSFVAEAFVIPTGSMATTLYGYQKLVTCPKCGIQFPVNCSQEVDPQDGAREIFRACVCPNCREPIELAKEVPVEERDPRTGARVPRMALKPLFDCKTGDRVLVAKFLYDLPWRAPQRLDVVVFKYPEKPQKDYTPLNYIKRLVGLPGETIAIYYGKLYYLKPDPDNGLKYDDSGVNPLDLWQYRYMHADDPTALELFNKGKFTIVRKPPAEVLAMRRLVYDNDHPASDIKEQRWVDHSAAKAWAEDEKARTFKHAAADESRLAWLRYRHLIVRDGRNKPELITDFMDYNSWQSPQTYHWVGDLMIDCDVTVEKAEGQLVLELSRGPNRFRALFDLATGDCTLKKVKHSGREAPADDAGEKLDTKPTGLKKPGTYHVRFANVDERLLVWVDKSLPFGDDGVPYNRSEKEKRGPTADNDLEPASVGVQGAGVTVGKLQLWRDTYYTQLKDSGDHGGDDNYPKDIDFADPSTWGPLHDMPPRTLYVQPGHYLCMGDNSPHSSDGRAWGTVPERLMLGRALVVYFPFGRVGMIR
jgi:signal peptidase I